MTYVKPLAVAIYGMYRDTYTGMQAVPKLKQIQNMPSFEIFIFISGKNNLYIHVAHNLI